MIITLQNYKITDETLFSYLFGEYPPAALDKDQEVDEYLKSDEGKQRIVLAKNSPKIAIDVDNYCSALISQFK
jgi:hypothetical protein